MAASGNDIGIYVDGDLIGCVTNATYNRTMQEIDVTCKDANGSKAILSGGEQSEISFEGFFDPAATYGFQELLLIHQNKIRVQVQMLYNGTGSLSFVYYAYLNQIEWTGPLNAGSTFSGTFTIDGSEVIVVDPNIALGDTFLTTNAKTRAYWNFTTQLTGVEDAAITSVSDLRGNGWNLGNFSGAATPKEGLLQEGLNNIKALKANTSAGFEQGLVGSSGACTNLLKNDVEVHILCDMFDGQSPTIQYLFGSADGGTRYFRFGINPSGNLSLEYAASAAGLSTIVSSGFTIPNNYTGIMLIRLRCDFTTDVISGSVNGNPVTFSVSSGNAISSWVAANWFNSRAIGVGGNWSGPFDNDGAPGSYKYILKTAVTDLLTDDEYLILAASFLNY